jgi:acetyltransferase-like isoleucine patch superfamily enzyme
MSLLWDILDRGNSRLDVSSFGMRLTTWCGRRLALRHRPAVSVPKSCRIHPAARIHPRKGRIRFGERCQVAANAIVQGPVVFGDGCSVQTGSILVGYGEGDDADGAIRIGNRVRIAPFVQMIAGNHDISDPGAPIGRIVTGRIVIEDNVWVAGRVIITAGVTVGRNAVLAAGAVVTRDVPPYAVVGGVPAKVIRDRCAEREAAGSEGGI